MNYIIIHLALYICILIGNVVNVMTVDDDLMHCEQGQLTLLFTDQVLTRDAVTVCVDAVIYYKIKVAEYSIMAVENMRFVPKHT